MPISWPTIANMHPFAPQPNTKGYREMLHELEQYLCHITAFDACSLQPASGAAGEYDSAYAQPGLAPNGLALSWLLWKLLWRPKTELEIKQFQNAGCTK